MDKFTVCLTGAELGTLLLALDEYREHHPDASPNHVRPVLDSTERALNAATVFAD